MSNIHGIKNYDHVTTNRTTLYINAMNTKTTKKANSIAIPYPFICKWAVNIAQIHLKIILKTEEIINLTFHCFLLIINTIFLLLEEKCQSNQLYITESFIKTQNINSTGFDKYHILNTCYIP